MSAPFLQVTGINHVVLHVSDVDRSMRFYQEVLGFETRSTSADPARKMRFLRCGMQGLDLFEIEGDVHGGLEMNHMALEVEAEDLDEVLAGLSKAGVDSKRTPRNSVFIHDPDGHQIEMLPKNAQERQRHVAVASGASEH